MTGLVTTIDTIKEEGLLANAGRVGQAMLDNLKNSLGNVAGVADIRGMGLMIGVELDRPCGELVRTALEAGLGMHVTADNVIDDPTGKRGDKLALKANDWNALTLATTADGVKIELNGAAVYEGKLPADVERPPMRGESWVRDK